MIVFAAGMIAIGVLPTVLMAKSGMTMSLSRVATNANEMNGFFIFLVFTAGIIGNDIKTGWLRTLLIRSVTRQQYLFSKLSAVYCSTILVYIITFSVAAVVLFMDSGVLFDIDGQIAIYVLVLESLQILLTTILSAWISCYLPGMVNSVAVYGWMAISQMIHFFVNRAYWDVKWLSIMKEYLFPDGFTNAQTSIMAQMPFPYGDLLWGCAALCGAVAASAYAINRVVVDSGSE